MSIPGLGQFSSAATPVTSTALASASTSTTVSLQPFWEYRFEASFSTPLNIRLLSGTAEKDGTELAPNVTYAFQGVKSKINTWQGCELEISCENAGAYDGHVSEMVPGETPLVSYLNLHMKLEGLRAAAAANKGSSDAMGPRVFVVGPSNSGKTSLVRMLTGWATRMGSQPLVVNTDSTQGMLSLPGTLSAAVFATLMDITTEWGGTPSSGPAGVPVKLPLAYYYGLEKPESNPKLFKSILSRLAMASTSRLSEDPDVKRSGMLVDSGAVNTAQPNYDLLTHIINEFSINIIITLGSEQLTSELTQRCAGQKTSLGEDIVVIGLDKSSGVAERDTGFMQQVRERTIKEYFFGDAKRTLSPATQNIGFESVTVWKIAEDLKSDNDDFYDPGATETSLEKVEPSLMMLNCTLAIMYAKPRDSPETVREANVMGYLYITDVDETKKRLKVLSPVNARLGDRPLLWGNWPEPMVSLLD